MTRQQDTFNGLLRVGRARTVSAPLVRPTPPQLRTDRIRRTRTVLNLRFQSAVRSINYYEYLYDRFRSGGFITRSRTRPTSVRFEIDFVSPAQSSIFLHSFGFLFDFLCLLLLSLLKRVRSSSRRNGRVTVVFGTRQRRRLYYNNIKSGRNTRELINQKRNKNCEQLLARIVIR